MLFYFYINSFRFGAFNIKLNLQITIQQRKSANMSQSIRINCIKVSDVLVFMLLFQPIQAQYNFNALDKKLDRYQKSLGNNAGH